MSTSYFAMVNIPLDGELRWGTCTADALHDERAVGLRGRMRVFCAAAGPDVEQSMCAELAGTARAVLQAPGFQRMLDRRHATRVHWFLWESNQHLRELPPEQVSRTARAALEYHPGATPHMRKALIEVSPAPTGVARDAFVTALVRQLDAVFAATPAIARGAGLAPTLEIGPPQEDPADRQALLRLRESLLARDWPDSAAVGRRLGSSDASALARVSRERAAGTLFGVWTGRDRGGYRHPDFQFLPSGSVHPRLPELLDALARQPDLTPQRDRSGWERAYWLYQPRGRLSVQALALRAASPAQLRADPARFAAIDSAARTPAEVFATDPQAVIDLAREDAGHVHGPPVAGESALPHARRQ